MSERFRLLEEKDGHYYVADIVEGRRTAETFENLEQATAAALRVAATPDAFVWTELEEKG